MSTNNQTEGIAARRTLMNNTNRAAMRLQAHASALRARFDSGHTFDVTEQGPIELLFPEDERTDDRTAELVEQIQATARRWRVEMEQQFQTRDPRPAKRRGKE